MKTQAQLSCSHSCSRDLVSSKESMRSNSDQTPSLSLFQSPRQVPVPPIGKVMLSRENGAVTGSCSQGRGSYGLMCRDGSITQT